jgi:hypothetical protein
MLDRSRRVRESQGEEVGGDRQDQGGRHGVHHHVEGGCAVAQRIAEIAGGGIPDEAEVLLVEGSVEPKRVAQRRDILRRGVPLAQQKLHRVPAQAQ